MPAELDGAKLTGLLERALVERDVGRDELRGAVALHHPAQFPAGPPGHQAHQGSALLHGLARPLHQARHQAGPASRAITMSPGRGR